MYARYIPPSKGSAKSQSAAVSPPAKPTPEPAPVQVTTVDAGGSTYGRFIPVSKKSTEPSPSHPVIQRFEDDGGSAAKRKRETKEDVVEFTPKKAKTTTNDKVDSAKKDAKKKRKRKSRTAGSDSENEAPEKPTKAGSDEDDVQVEEAADEAVRQDPMESSKKPSQDADMPDADERGESKTDSSKTKKPKKEKKKKAKDGLDENHDDVEQPRHKAVLERREKSLKLAGQSAKTVSEEPEEEETEQHGLEPLPQPEEVPVDDARPSYETLPSWLAAPIRVDQSTRKPFSQLGLLPKAAKVLQEKGYPDAFAVQTAAIPLLLPSSRQQPGDVLISAATGSGKTLAYALPVVKDISQGLVTRLRALVVLPTRELVRQAQEVFELCARAYEGNERKRVRIGISTGSQTLRSEQEALIESESRYDPPAYRDLPSLEDTVYGNARKGSIQRAQWEGQVVEYHSRVDVLICTPGRLVEHLEQTPGFNLDYVRWLVVDEADKLLAQSFQGWLDMVMESFQFNRDTARDFPDMNLSGVRKVILSATLTRDLSLLTQLRLRRPQLIVLEGNEGVQIAEHTLPETLSEYAIRVHNDSLKPLYLHELLTGHHMAQKNLDTANAIANQGAKPARDTSPESDTSSDSDTTSDSDSSFGSDTDDSLASMKADMVRNYYPQSLVFTKSNESALRLSRLLGLLDCARSSQISTLTSTTPSHVRRKTLKSFSKPLSPIRIVIASDLVARGIDIPDLANVINYDLPPSVAGYVHRVGRTARAGKYGRAWTLVGDAESGWFWGKIAKAQGVKRPQKVARILIDERTEDEVARYEEALEKLGQEAVEARKR